MIFPIQPSKRRRSLWNAPLGPKPLRAKKIRWLLINFQENTQWRRKEAHIARKNHTRWFDRWQKRDKKNTIHKDSTNTFLSSTNGFLPRTPSHLFQPNCQITREIVRNVLCRELFLSSLLKSQTNIYINCASDIQPPKR